VIFSDRVKDAAVERDQDENGHVWCDTCSRGPLVYVPKYLPRNPRAKNFDHIISEKNGGSNTLDNCRIVCIDCNLEKALREGEAVYPLSCDGKIREGEEDAIRWMSAKQFERIQLEKILRYIPWKGFIR